jgi:PAS domain S-box-containing protein
MSDEDRTTPFPFVTDITFQRGDVVFATDPRGRLVYWNKECQQLFGHAADEVVGNPFDVICLAAPAGSKVDLPAILSGGDLAGGMRCFHKSSKEIALYVYATAGRDQSGAAVGVVFVARDVTPFWRAEQAVRTAEDRYRMLFEHSSDAMALTEVEGRVLEANPACLRLYGYTADEARQLNLADMVAPEHRADAAEAMADLAAGEPVTKTIKMLRKDGTQFVVDLVASVVSVDGERRILSVTRDVTERVSAEQATNESERKYRLVFESANDAVLIETVDGLILEANQHACDLLGYTREELLKLRVSNLVPVEARTWLPRVTDAILRDGTFRAEAVNVHKSGRRIPVEISASTMEMDDRTLVLAIVRDISERKRADAALAESENRYRTLFNDSRMGIYRTTPDGQIQLANPALVRMLGYDSFAQLAQRNLETDGSGPEYKRDEFKRRLERDGRIVGLEVRWQTRDGRTLFIRESARAVRGPDGAVLYYEGTVEDITERRQAEQALREGETNFRAMAENSADGVAVAAESGRFIYVNSRLAGMFGYPVERLLGMSFGDLLRPDDAVALSERYARRMRGETVPSQYELTVLRADGQSVLVEISVSRTLWHGRPASLVSLRDISKRREAEETADELRAVLDNSPGAIAGECEGKLVYANQRFVRMFGYESPDQVVGRPASDFAAPEDRASLMEYSRMRERGEDAPARYVFRGLKRDGTIVPMEATVSTYRSLGRLHIQAVIREIEEIEPGPGGR